MSRRRPRWWPWILTAGVALVAVVSAWMWLRPVESPIPVPGRPPAPREKITDTERERLRDILEKRASEPRR